MSATTATETTDSTLQRKKEIVREFYDLAFNQKKPDQAAAKYIGPRYIQHNPMAPDGKNAFVAFVKGFVAQYPSLRVDFKRSIAEGDLVAMHSHIIPQPGAGGLAVVDIFRLENDKIVEHWDVIQEVAETSANNNGMF